MLKNVRIREQFFEDICATSIKYTRIHVRLQLIQYQIPYKYRYMYKYMVNHIYRENLSKKNHIYRERERYVCNVMGKE